jgi:DNA-binding transcriptional LysR family regulator
MLRITFKQLKIFAVIAQKQNMSHAAEILHLSQSACSMALAALENQLNCMLFDRHAKQLILNENGRFFLPKVLNLLAQAEEIQSWAEGAGRQELAGHLIIGASSTIGNYILPQIIGRFTDQNPHTRIFLQVGNTQQVIQSLLEFKIDVGFIEGGCYAENIKTTSWRQDQLVIIAAPAHPLARKKNLKLADLIESRWILREPGSGTRERFEHAMDTKITPFLELGHTEAIKNAVQAGLGISCLSEVTVAESIKNKQLVILKTPFLNLTRPFYLFVHQDKHPTNLLKAFLHQLT